MTDYDLRTKRALRRVVLLEYGFGPETLRGRKVCPVCGRAFLPDGRTRYCSEACAGAARRKKQRGYMRKYRG